MQSLCWDKCNAHAAWSFVVSIQLILVRYGLFEELQRCMAQGLRRWPPPMELMGAHMGSSDEKQAELLGEVGGKKDEG